MNSEIVMEISIPSQIIIIVSKFKDPPLAEQNRIRKEGRVRRSDSKRQRRMRSEIKKTTGKKWDISKFQM
jgi:hypothetical protein